MRKRPPAAAMSLFSYLDGLVCTMGALILLLLLTTHRIRQQVVADYQSQSETTVAAAPSFADDDLEARKREIAAQLAAHQQSVAEHEAATKAQHAAWQAKLDDLARLNQQLAGQVSQKRSIVDNENAAVAQVAGERDKLAALMTAAAQHKDQILLTESELRQQAEDLLRLRENCLKKIDSAKVQQALQKPVFEIVAHDGNSGTDRRPILIECTADSLTFASEGIRLTAATLNEFSADVNPLLAGTEALLTYWTLVDSQAGRSKSSGPYVLMIVRPGGTVAFYVARKYLEKLNQDFGYELVTADAEFKWPPADPQAVEVCQRAIDRVLAGQRPEQKPTGSGMGPGGGGAMARRGPGSGGTGLGGTGSSNAGQPGGEMGGGAHKSAEDQIVGADGEFSLAEVEQLKNAQPGDSIDMLGPEWSQRRRAAQAAAGAAGQGSEQGTETAAGANAARGNSATKPTGPGGRPQSAAGQKEDGRPGSEDGASTKPAPGTEQPEGMPIPNFNPNPQQSRGAGKSGSGKPGERQMPPPPLTQAQQQSNWNDDGGEQRKWGRSQPTGAIGIERSLTLHLQSDRIKIEDGETLGLPVEMSRPEFQEAVSFMIDSHAQSWGSPPAKFFWRPSLKVKIHPGGNQHYPRLKELLDHWGLSYKVEHVLD
ncbi:hypothetical protein [Planctomicrobium piriforme]|uniref:Uncharacterized protein n=1 Tax=Planctomicrobium piriforme TaxID=1576369 RepID=A0A1I3PDA2_9PLAN|nr:hypothetical protein [Planctomicrobium piriforme]SFJ19391.1 hypothetical protein SAMN05421753_116113 [Planctomicrobium piriforme]